MKQTLSLKNTILLLFITLLGVTKSQAQTEPNMQDMATQLMQLQRMMMQGMEKGGFSNDDSTFVFQMDTTFLGNPTDLFKGHEQEMEQIKQFFGGFMDMVEGMDGTFPQGESPEGSEYLDENGDDDLLPEERLRLKEEGHEAVPDKKMTTKPKPEKRKTVRI
jgi:hypothetical protein